MAKISLEKDTTAAELNAKLDFIIREISDLRREVNRLKSADEENICLLDTKIRDVTRDLKDELYKIDRRIYNGHDEVSRDIRKIDKKIADNSPLSLLIIPAVVTADNRRGNGLGSDVAQAAEIKNEPAATVTVSFYLIDATTDIAIITAGIAIAANFRLSTRNFRSNSAAIKKSAAICFRTQPTGDFI